MPDVFQVLNLFLAYIAAHYADQIDLVAYYGSYAKGTATAHSDLDMFYVPSEGKNPPVARSVIISGVLFDFWPLSWDRLESLATGRWRGWSLAPALVFHARPVYVKSGAAEERLEELKQKIVALQQPEARPVMIRRALTAFPAVLAHLGNLRLAAAGGDVVDVRYAGFNLLFAAWECLALANQVLFDEGYFSVVTQAAKMPVKPAGFETLVQTICTSMQPRDILSAGEELALGTRQILWQFQQSTAAGATTSTTAVGATTSTTAVGATTSTTAVGATTAAAATTATGATTRTVPEVFAGAYPELKDGWRKILNCCEAQRSVEAAIAAWRQQEELSGMVAELHRLIGRQAKFNLYREFGSYYAELDWPNLLACDPHETHKLARETELVDRICRQWLKEHSVNLEVYESIEKFRQSLV
ncbi:MAG TPA: hypothetical protein GXX29_01840 [Firmicutes bacterium]|nr:hypothetical protein [Bacillota bacterium]